MIKLTYINDTKLYYQNNIDEYYNCNLISTINITFWFQKSKPISFYIRYRIGEIKDENVTDQSHNLKLIRKIKMIPMSVKGLKQDKKYLEAKKYKNNYSHGYKVNQAKIKILEKMIDQN